MTEMSPAEQKAWSNGAMSGTIIGVIIGIGIGSILTLLIASLMLAT